MVLTWYDIWQLLMLALIGRILQRRFIDIIYALLQFNTTVHSLGNMSSRSVQSWSLSKIMLIWHSFLIIIIIIIIKIIILQHLHTVYFIVFAIFFWMYLSQFFVYVAHIQGLLLKNSVSASKRVIKLIVCQTPAVTRQDTHWATADKDTA